MRQSCRRLNLFRYLILPSKFQSYALPRRTHFADSNGHCVFTFDSIWVSATQFWSQSIVPDFSPVPRRFSLAEHPRPRAPIIELGDPRGSNRNGFLSVWEVQVDKDGCGSGALHFLDFFRSAECGVEWNLPISIDLKMLKKIKGNKLLLTTD